MEHWVSAVITAFINVILAAFVYGRLTTSVSDQERRIGKLEAGKGAIWEKLSDHSERIVRLETKAEKSRAAAT